MLEALVNLCLKSLANELAIQLLGSSDQVLEKSRQVSMGSLGSWFERRGGILRYQVSIPPQ